MRLGFCAAVRFQSDWRNCGLFVALYVENGATLLVGIY